MLKYLMLFMASFHVIASANTAEEGKKTEFEDLFSEDELAVFKDGEDAILFDEITQAEEDPEELFNKEDREPFFQ
jgi:hypothetical protein